MTELHHQGHATARGSMPAHREPLTIRYSIIGITLFGVGGSSLMVFFASAYGVLAFKVLAVLLMLVTGYGTAILLRRYGDAIHPLRAVLALALLSVVPYLRILIEVLPTFSSRHILDGIFVFGPYYLMPFTGLAVVAYLASTGVAFDRCLRRILPWLAGLVALFAAARMVSLDPARIHTVYTIYNNFIIPAALLLFFPALRRNVLIGAAALTIMVVLSTIQGSRSYLLVFMYLGVFSLLFGPYRLQSKVLFIGLILLVAVAAGPTALQIAFSSGSDATILKKLKLASLLPTLETAFNNGDLLKIYFWEGNSRSGVLVDAFKGFTGWDYAWGRGLTATYESFVTRTTIEIGYAQELFWIGLVTLVPVFVYSLVALFGILMRPGWRSGFLGSAMVGIGLTRLLDGFILGMPIMSLYTLFYWMFVMQLALKARYRSALFRSGSGDARI